MTQRHSRAHSLPALAALPLASLALCAACIYPARADVAVPGQPYRRPHRPVQPPPAPSVEGSYQASAKWKGAAHSLTLELKPQGKCRMTDAPAKSGAKPAPKATTADGTWVRQPDGIVTASFKSGSTKGTWNFRVNGALLTASTGKGSPWGAAPLEFRRK